MRSQAHTPAEYRQALNFTVQTGAHRVQEPIVSWAKAIASALIRTIGFAALVAFLVTLAALATGG